jgi:hypothetical protein
VRYVVTALMALCLSLATTVPNHSGNAAQGSGKRKATLTFTTGMSGELIQDGADLGFTIYGAPDGGSLIVIYNRFRDETEATAILDKEIARAIKSQSRGPKKDASGKVVGERVQLLLPSGKSKPDDMVYAVAWTDGAIFHEIESASLPDVLTMEKIYKYPR